MATSSSSTSLSAHIDTSRQPRSSLLESKARACQRLGELFELTVPTTELICFAVAWEKCLAKDWALLRRCGEELKYILNDQGRSLLQQAIRIGEIALATDMIANGIAIHARDSMGNTAMHYAVQTERLNLVLELYGHTSQDARNQHEQTPLHYAAASGQLDAIKLLMANGANSSASTQVTIHDPNASTQLAVADLVLPSLTPLAFAAIKGDCKCVDVFLSANRCNPALNLNLRFGSIGNLVHLLILFHHHHILEYVLKTYPEQIFPLLNEPCCRGLTPFMLAAYLGEVDVLIILKEYLRDIINLEAIDSEGKTALHHAVLGRQRKSVAFLHSVGANFMASDELGKTPLNLAEGDDTESQSMQGYLLNLSKSTAKAHHSLPNFVIDPPENLIFKGNDPTGFKYLGVIRALEIKGKIKGVLRLTGVSMAAFISTLLALGNSFADIASLTDKISIFCFLDSPIAHHNISDILKDSPYATLLQRLLGIIKKNGKLGKEEFVSLINEPAICSEKGLLEFIEEQIFARTKKHNCTFGELNELVRTQKLFKHLTIFTTCFGDRLMLKRFSSEDVSSKDVVISHVVCAALSIPGIFPAKSLFVKNSFGDVDESLSLGLHGDAAMINNFPIEAHDLEKYQTKTPLSEEAGDYFRLNKRTLGVAFAPHPLSSTFTDDCTVQELVLQAISVYCQIDPTVQQVISYNNFRIIQIENPIGELSTQPLEETRESLINAGVSTIVDFFDQQERLSASAGSFRFCYTRPNQGSRWTNLKPPLPYFAGRFSHMSFLKQRLIDETAASSSGASSSSSSIPQGRTRCVVLAGAEGMGKSETVIQFAHQYRDRFSVIWWIEAATPQSMERSFRELAEALHISINQTHSSEYIRREVFHYLESEPLGSPYLLIFDNAEESIDLPTVNNGRFIVTTTESKDFSGNVILPIGVFDQEEAVDVLQIILEQEKNEEMCLLADALEYLPVILSQAAQHIRSTRMTLTTFLELLAEEKLKVISMMRSDGRYSKTQISAWRITHKRLEEHEPIVYEWLEICAYLQPDAIPFSYLEMWLQLFKSHLSHVERIMTKSLIVETLNRLGILRFDETRGVYSLHRIRQEMIRSSHEPEKMRFLRSQVMRVLVSIGRALNLEDNGEWLTFAPHESHFRFVIEGDDVEGGDDVEPVAEVEDQSENTCKANIGLSALFWVSTSVSVSPRVMMDPSDEVPDTGYQDEAYIRNLLGRWLIIQGKILEAKECLRKSLKRWRTNFSGDHIDLAHTLHILGNVSMTQVLMSDAEGYYLAAYMMRRRLYVGDHVELAASLHNLGRCCSPVVDVQKAENYFNEALAMLRRIYPDGHYLMALVLANKGVYYRSADRLEDAYVHTLEAMHLLERLYPVRNDGNYPFVGNQPLMAFVLSELGAIIRKQGKDGEAVDYYRRAITIQKNVDEKCTNNPYLLKSLGAALLNIGNYQEAKIICLESLDLHRKVNLTNAFAGDLLHNLGVIEYQLGQMDQASLYLRESLECYKISINQCIDHEDNIRVLKQAFRILYKVDNTQTKENAVTYFRDSGNSLVALGKEIEAALYFAEADRIERSWSCSIL